MMESRRSDSEILQGFLTEYQNYVRDVLEPTRVEVKKVLNSWREPGFWPTQPKQSRLPSPSPVQRIRIRIKRPESLVDKIVRKLGGYSGLTPQLMHQTHDALGARVIVYFLSGLPLIDNALRTSEDFELGGDGYPVAYLREEIVTRYGLTGMRRVAKNSGYASVHYLVRLKHGAVPEERRPWFELQVRTLAEDVWAEIEHVLGYKPEKHTSFAVRKQFQIISDQLHALDEHFSVIAEELSRFQMEATYKDNDNLNAENLPPVLAEVGIGCAQQEIDGLLKLFFSRGIKTVGSLRDVATTQRLEVIRSTYRGSIGRAPTGFEVCANLGTLAAAETDTNEGDLVRTQIEFLRAWDELQRRGPGAP